MPSIVVVVFQQVSVGRQRPVWRPSRYVAFGPTQTRMPSSFTWNSLARDFAVPYSSLASVRNFWPYSMPSVSPAHLQPKPLVWHGRLYSVILLRDRSAIRLTDQRMFWLSISRASRVA